MTEHTDDQLEEQLPALTQWEGDTPGLWRRALKASGGRGMQAWRRLLGVRVPGVAAAAIVLVAIIGGGLMLVDWPGSVVTWDEGEPEGSLVELRPSLQRPAAFMPESRWLQDGPLRFGGGGDGGGGILRPPDADLGWGGEGLTTAGVARRAPPGARGPLPSQSLPLGAEPLEADRHVVRKATIELETDDVRALFLKAAQLVSEAGGEYVESSSLTGSGRDAQANLTLRVRADRLSDVLNALRQLGTVESEQLSGEDVTAQVVDLEARLRNEQRVEAELLDLLESRQDAPLREILDLRQHLNIVRMSIERLAAQRQRIGRLVTLATVLVIIRPDDAPPEPKAGLGHYFGNRMLASWGGGLRLLTNTMAGALRLLVGGLLWWVILLIVLLRVRQYVRQQRMQEAVA